MALTVVTKRVTYGDGSTGLANFATDGANPPTFWPIALLGDSNGNPISDASGIPITGTVTGSVTALAGGAITNPTSTLTRPANTTAYASGQLIGTSTVAATASAGVPSFNIMTAAGGALLAGMALITTATTGWANISVLINLWLSRPTYTNGDGGAYVVSSGALSSGNPNWVGAFNLVFTQQFGDGAVGITSPLSVNEIALRLASGTSVFWDIQSQSAATPISGQKFILIPGLLN